MGFFILFMLEGKILHHNPRPHLHTATVQPSLWQHLGQTLKARSTQLKTSLTPHWSPEWPEWRVGGWWNATHWKKYTQVVYICISQSDGWNMSFGWNPPAIVAIVYVWNPIRNPCSIVFLLWRVSRTHPVLETWQPEKKTSTSLHKHRGSTATCFLQLHDVNFYMLIKAWEPILHVKTMFSSWWFQPIWKILVKMGIFPK